MNKTIKRPSWPLKNISIQDYEVHFATFEVNHDKLCIKCDITSP